MSTTIQPKYKVGDVIIDDRPYYDEELLVVSVYKECYDVILSKSKKEYRLSFDFIDNSPQFSIKTKLHDALK